MKQKKRFSIMRQKSYLAAGVIALVAVIAMAGIYYRGKNNAEEEETEAIVMAENEWDEDSGQEDPAKTQPEDSAREDAPAAEETAAEENSQEAEDVEGKVAETAAPVKEPVLHFSESDGLAWPLDGDVLINYSMDKSVYFATLDQYKYNPAVIIRGAVNDKVTAAADGQVISISPDAETGITVKIGMGDGYEAVYGQLKQVELEPGEFIERGDLVGFVNEPTKYYSVEGSNLYFALTKDGVPVNPMDYFD